VVVVRDTPAGEGHNGLPEEIQDDLLAKTNVLAPYLELSLRHAKTLRPKATTKKRS